MPKQLALLDERPPLVLDGHLDGLSIRESSRARRLILHVVPPHRLELVVPVGTRPQSVEAFVKQHESWIDKARSEIRLRYRADRNRFPDTVSLTAVGRQFAVTYRQGAGLSPGYAETDGSLEIRSAAPELQDANEILRRWLLAQGRRYLNPWLHREARIMGEEPRRLQVRLQRTRWGSCSATGTISMNASLLLLDRRLVRYLMIHELSHMKSLNHSARFWARVRRYEPDYEALDRELANAWTQIPYWVLAS